MEKKAQERVTSRAAGTPLSRRAVLVGGAGIAGGLALGVVTTAPATAAQQDGWRWCNRCQCLFYSDNYTSGWCCRGGGHNWQGSGSYTPNYDDDHGQDEWRWCYKCQSMWYGGGNSNGQCPDGYGHSSKGSGNYTIEYGHAGNYEQSGWRWCNKCCCLCYSGNGSGYCPAGGHHGFNRSGNYYLPYD